jgi:hypothetical protein
VLTFHVALFGSSSAPLTKNIAADTQTLRYGQTSPFLIQG